MLADPVLSRELKSLQEELATAQRQCPVQSADRLIKSEVQTTTNSDTVASGGTAATAGRLRVRFVSAVVLGAALICVALLITSALGVSDRGLLIVRAYAQSKRQNPLEKARTAVETLINRLRGIDMPEGIVKTNGRLEATQVDVAAKYPGRLATLTVDEGDEVTAGQVVGTISSPETEAQLRAAQAQLQKAKQALAAAVASIAQKKSELDIFQRRLSARKNACRAREHISADGVISAATGWTRPMLHMFRPMRSVTKLNPQSSPRRRMSSGCRRFWLTWCSCLREVGVCSTGSLAPVR